MYKLRNQQYRDELVKFSYPFDAESILQDEKLNIGTDLFLDAILFFKEDVELPVYISEIDGTVGDRSSFSVIISDINGQIVARTEVVKDEEKSEVFDNQGSLVGFLITTEEGFQRFSSTVTGRVHRLNQDVARFDLDVCSVSKTPHLRGVVINDVAVSGELEIVARHGTRLALNSGVMSLDVFSDVDSGNPPLRYVNGVDNPSIWLNHHPELNLRIVTNSTGVEFRHARDDT